MLVNLHTLECDLTQLLVHSLSCVRSYCYEWYLLTIIQAQICNPIKKLKSTTSMYHLEVTLCGRQNTQIKLPTNQYASHSTTFYSNKIQ